MMRLAGSVAAVLVAFSAAGQLEWDTQAWEHHMEPGQEQVSTTYSFRNTGDAPITIGRITSTCGCTVPELDKRRYEPGESGEIEAVFNAGRLTGRQSSTIVVMTDYEASPTYVLRMIVHIPEVLRLSTNTLTWTVGEAPEPRTIDIHGGLEEPVHIRAVESSTPQIETQLEELEPGARYRVTAAPTDTSSPVFGVIRISAQHSGDEQATVNAHARVLPESHTLSQAPPARQVPATRPNPSGQSSATIEPRMLVWRENEGSHPKQLRVRIEGDDPVVLTGVRPSNDDFLHIFQETEAGREYVLTLTPRGTDTPARTIFQFESDSELERPVAAVGVVLAGS